MDPNANLREQRAIIERAENDASWQADTDRLIELVSALDQWISNGGLLPAAWQKAQIAR